MGDENRNLVSTPEPPKYDTRLGAQRAIKSAVSGLEASILALLRERATAGATCDEIEVLLDASHQTISGRITSLVKRGLMHDGGQRRKSRTGRESRVYLYGQGQGPAPRARPATTIELLAEEVLAAYNVDNAAHLDETILVQVPIKVGTLRALHRFHGGEV